MYVVVLAGSIREATQHAKKHELPRGRWRYAVKASTIRGLRVAEIHILPGFHKRLDRHSILAALRYTKGKRIEFTPRDEVAFFEPDPLELEKNRQREDEIQALEEAAADVPVKRKRKAPVSNTLETPTVLGGFF